MAALRGPQLNICFTVPAITMGAGCLFMVGALLFSPSSSYSASQQLSTQQATLRVPTIQTAVSIGSINMRQLGHSGSIQDSDIVMHSAHGTAADVSVPWQPQGSSTSVSFPALLLFLVEITSAAMALAVACQYFLSNRGPLLLEPINVTQIALAAMSGFPEDSLARKQSSSSRRLPPLRNRMKDEDFVDVEMHLMNYLTYKSVKIVLNQLVETDLSPMKSDYMWLRRFALENSLADSEAFLKKLSTTRPQFADRLLQVRLDAFTQFSKYHDEESLRQRIADSDLRIRKHQLNASAQLDFEDKRKELMAKAMDDESAAQQ